MVEPPNFRKPIFGQDFYWRPLAAPPRGVIGQGIAVSDTEILMVAHHLPITVVVGASGTTVQALTTSRALLRKAFDAQTCILLRGYIPILLRALPFRLSHPDKDLEVLVDQLVGSASDGRSIYSLEGTLDPTVARVRDTLVRCHTGIERLTAAANQLFAANLLVELPALADERRSIRCYTVNFDALQSLGKLQLVGLASNGFLTMDLIASLIFSMRHLRPGVRNGQGSNTDIGPVPMTAEAIDRLVREAGRIELELDDGDMIHADVLSNIPLDGA